MPNMKWQAKVTLHLSRKEKRKVTAMVCRKFFFDEIKKPSSLKQNKLQQVTNIHQSSSAVLSVTLDLWRSCTMINELPIGNTDPTVDNNRFRLDSWSLPSQRKRQANATLFGCNGNEFHFSTAAVARLFCAF